MAQNVDKLPSHYRPPRKANVRWWARPWVIPLVMLAFAFLGYQLNQFWGNWDTPAAPVAPHAGFPHYFWFLAGHMTGGFIAMFTAVLQLWPWLRKNHPLVHRVSGRLYVVGTLLGGTCGLIIVRFAPPAGKVGITAAVIMWMVTTVIAWVLAMRGKYELHRRFMLYSFATLMSIVWGVPIVQIGLAMPTTISPTYINYLIEASRWTGWVADLLIVQWFLLRAARRPQALRGRKSPAGDAAAATVPPVQDQAA